MKMKSNCFSIRYDILAVVISTSLGSFSQPRSASISFLMSVLRSGPIPAYITVVHTGQIYVNFCIVNFY